jgi:nucleoside-diphosphate kinase|tara:strand:- start:265 stop:684 length:420 start_codon:yes stop_codon:yes gene_type:complete
MSGNRTFTMLKPDTVESNNIGNVTQMITDAGFVIKAMKLTQLSKDQAKEFYSVHKERPFYGELVEYMTSGPIVAAVLEKDNAVEDFRNLIGSTDPSEAEDGTIRKKYAESKGRNAVHGSDSDENAQIEADFHFNKEDLV